MTTIWKINAKGRGDVRFVDSSVPAREDKEKGGATKTIYYAKAGRAETAAKLDLELVPTVANGNIFVLIFRARPCPRPNSRSSARPSGKNRWSPMSKDA
jgi:hypothetical protein